MLVLASASPRRVEILRQLGIQFKQHSVEIEESILPHESAETFVCRLSREKAEAVAPMFPDNVVLGSDTIVQSPEGIPFGKPTSRLDAIEMLMQLSGKTHVVLTGVTCLKGDAIYTEMSRTQVTMRRFSIDEAQQYWETNEPQGKAGAYAIQGYGAALISSINGSFTGVVGLPVEVLIPMLKTLDISYWNNLLEGTV